MTDYRKMTKAQLDAAILYQVSYGRDLQRLDHLIAARNHKEQSQWQDKLQAGTLSQSEKDQLQWQLDRMDMEGATLADAAKVFDELEAE